MVLTYIAALLFIALVLFVVVPEVADTVGKVKELLPGFVNRAKELALAYTKNVPAISEKIAGIEPDFDQIFSFFNDNGGEIMSATVSIFSSIIGTVINIFIGIIFSAYILAQKEKLGRQTKLVIYALFKEKTADELMVFGKIASTTFSKFFTGQFREGIILGIMFMIAMAIAGIQYPLTIGVLIAFTALIPVFGAFIGLFIGCFLLLVVDPKQVLWFVLLFFILQFIENYFIYPKLVGGDINLPAIWVLLAVIAGGDLMGVVGMFIFIPLVSVLYAYFRSIVYRRIKKREINVDDKQVPDDVVPLESAGRRLFAMKSKVEKRTVKNKTRRCNNMYKEVPGLVLYRDLGQDSILYCMADIFEAWEKKTSTKEELVTRIYQQIKRILDVATSYGFNRNLWQDYLAFLLITNENSFTLTCEKVGAGDGSVNAFAKNDYAIFKRLFHFDFAPIEKDLGIDCFTTITNYKSLPKKEQMYNQNVSEKVRDISDRVSEAESVDEIFAIMTAFYKQYGVGMFGLNKAFRIRHDEGKELEFIPITNTDKVMLDDLIGYEIQKKKLVDNTEAFVLGKKANNCLLFGDSGTGKSTSIKAIINQYYEQGLRMIEIYKHQFKDLSAVISHVKNRNYKFIIYMDDLSFEEFEIEYKYLKAVIEGGLETKPDNVLIYATSNRRHLIKETWNDRDDVETDNGMHRSDTMQEKLSLVNRFGVTISYSRPSRNEFNDIVLGLAKKHPEIGLTEQELLAEANKWELSHGGVSGRTAQQFMNYLSGKA